jgi:glycosyltransferase involved in cell wall biosynthesis
VNAAATIVIPLKSQYDAWLDQCVRSALNQTVPCEVIVVKSRDTQVSNLRILERLRRDWPLLRILMEDQAGSFPGAINQGIRAAANARIGLLLSDDWLDPEAVEHCLPLTSDIVCTGQTTYYADGVTIQQAASETLTMARYRSLRTLEAKARYLEHFFLFRKEAVTQAGGLDESIGNYPGIDDYDLIWTLLERGATVSIVEKRLYNYRDHDGDRLTLADPGRAAGNLKKILRKHGISEDDVPGMVASASKWFGKPIHRVMRQPTEPRP